MIDRANVEGWLGERAPPMPNELEGWIFRALCSGDTLVGSLVESGAQELTKALEVSGRVRESAFHLLAADALITYACEAAADEGDPQAALESIITRLQHV
jgi:hypothetical protein